ncbi:MAG: hypothetical protein M1817_002657 [Caeruleum heppii]|nr:MAG: hypothetical protein M1817_002657 [Caeruleum heppii]
MTPANTPLTHFLCIPLATEAARHQLSQSLQLFKVKASTLIKWDDDRMPESIVRPVSTLHLTLGVMSLREPGHVEGAVRLLQDLDTEILLADARRTASSSDGSPKSDEKSHAPLGVSLGSLTPMQSPTHTSILYAKPIDETDRLFSFCKRVREKFVEAGFVVAETRPLLLHATILNTVYAPVRARGREQDHGDDSGHAKGSRRRKIAFDATTILESYRGTIFAENIQLERLTICKMGARKLTNSSGTLVDEVYEVVAARSIVASPAAGADQVLSTF